MLAGRQRALVSCEHWCPASRTPSMGPPGPATAPQAIPRGCTSWLPSAPCTALYTPSNFPIVLAQRWLSPRSPLSQVFRS
eukprot:scaffold86197_cov67-Phaeocystis_antarctica.AAC.3